VRYVHLPQTGENRRDISIPVDGLLIEIEYPLQRVAKQPTGKISGQFQNESMLYSRAVLILVHVQTGIGCSQNPANEVTVKEKRTCFIEIGPLRADGVFGRPSGSGGI
jgi:hypothetical protein